METFSNNENKENTNLQINDKQNNLLELTKTYLRSTLYDTLKSQCSKNSTKLNDPFQEMNIYNITKIQYTLIADFLSKINFNYTLQVFNNEIKTILNPTTPFTDIELSKILNINFIDNQKMFFSQTFSDLIKSTFLYSIIISKNLTSQNEKIKNIDDNKNNIQENKKYFSDFANESTKSNLANSSYMSSIEDKLNEIDNKYNQKININNLLPQHYLTDAKFMQYKREIAQEYSENLKNEVERIKSTELSKLLIEENSKFLSKMEKMQNEYESTYELKFKELQEKESKLKQKENSLEENYSTKNNELMEEYNQKVQNFNEKELNFNKKCIQELKKLKEKIEFCEKKEKEIHALRKNYNEKLENELNKIKSELKNILKEEIKKINRENQKELEKTKDKIYLDKINATIDNNTTQIQSEYFTEINNLKKDLAEIKEKYNLNKNKNNEDSISSCSLRKDEDLKYYEEINKFEQKLDDFIDLVKFKKVKGQEKKVNKSTKENITKNIKDEEVKKKISELENEQKNINNEMKNDINNIINENIPQTKLTKAEIEKIKKNNYNIILLNNAKDKALNNYYKIFNEEENIKNKVKYIDNINKNTTDMYETLKNQQNYIIIDENEMEKHEQNFLKLYRQKKEQLIYEQKQKEIEKQKELERQKEIEKQIEIERKKEIERLKKASKHIEKKYKDEEKSQITKSILLPPVRNPNETIASVKEEIENMINQSKIRIAKNPLTKSTNNSKIQNSIKKTESIKNSPKKENVESEKEYDEYGSGDFESITSGNNKTEEGKNNVPGDSTLSANIDKFINNSNNNISENIEKEPSYSYEFETSTALNKKGINSGNISQIKESKNSGKRDSILGSSGSDEDYHF